MDITTVRGLAEDAVRQAGASDGASAQQLTLTCKVGDVQEKGVNVCTFEIAD